MSFRGILPTLTGALLIIVSASFALPNEWIGSSSVQSEVLAEVLETEKPINQDLLVQASSVAQIEVPIIVYHHIRPDAQRRAPRLRQYEVTPEEFEEHLRFLKVEGYTSVGFKDLREAFDGDMLPSKPVIITFDDGRGNQYDAWKMLSVYGFHGTWFVFTNAIGRPDYLTWQQLEEMRDAGEEVESHTLYHPDLTKLSDDELKQEMTKSRDMIAKHLGYVPLVFAYPFGLADDRVVAAAHEAGYTMARGLTYTNSQTSEGRMDLGSRIATGDMRQFKSIFTATKDR